MFVSDMQVIINVVLDSIGKEMIPFRNIAVSVKALWYPTVTYCHYTISHFIFTMVLHVIPAVILDIIFRIMGQKPRMLKLYRQIHTFGDVTNFFMSTTFKFENRNMKRVCNTYVLRSLHDYVNLLST